MRPSPTCFAKIYTRFNTREVLYKSMLFGYSILFNPYLHWVMDKLLFFLIY